LVLNKMNVKKFRLASIENAPLIRKFTVLFIVMSLLPFLVIVFLFMQYNTPGTINMDKNILFLLIFLVGPGIIVGFYGMRRSIVKIQSITQQATKALAKDIPSLAKETTLEESEVAQLTRTFSETTRSLENNIKRLEASKQTMQYVLSKLAVAISSLQNIDTFLDLIVEITANALEAQTGVLMLFDEERQELYVKSASGFDESLKNIRLKIDEEAPGWVAKHKKPILISELHKTESPQKGLFAPPLLCAPMLYQDRLIGVLTVTGKLTGGNFEEDELLIISNLASQTAIAVENEKLHFDAERTYVEIISALAMAVEARDPYSRGHSDRVSQYSIKTAEKLGLGQELIKDIKDAAELHDIGKIGISDEILKKIEDLNENEMEVMRRHPVIGEGIIKPVHSLSTLCGIVRHHHEWLDGTGYPDGLKADEIPLGAKILAVADSFDAMTTDRAYRKALSYEAAKEELEKYIDIRYDRKVVEAFLSVA
jgi:HD-GYP domain-containing protein (c-di-GMP phosphodiesterase class II)